MGSIMAACCTRRRRNDAAEALHAQNAPPVPVWMGYEVPLLVQVLGGNPVTAAAVLACLNTSNANPLRRLHPALAAAVAAVPWGDTRTRVRDIARWRAALPAAVGLYLDVPHNIAALTALEMLDCCYTDFVETGVGHLPPTLRKLCLSHCALPDTADFSHLCDLRDLRRVRYTKYGTVISAATAASLPPSLEVLDVSYDGSRDRISAPWPRH